MVNELLVLGQIPGTNFQITFAEVVIIYSLAILLFFRRRLLNFTKSYTQKTVIKFDEAEASRQLRLPV